MDQQENPSLRLVVGLGNPGKKYRGTRHNAGFAVADEVARRWGVKLKKAGKWKAEVGQVNDIFLLKPLTFMNLSGESVGPFARFYKIPLESMLIVYDEKDLPLGKLRLRPSGSSGGHNGLRNIITICGSESIPRLRVGIGSPSPQMDTVSHVLGKFTEEEQKEYDEAIARGAEVVQHVRAHGLQSAMNEFN
jgi:PTH1 family peptidyl-tRNA hydrolase